MSNETELTPQTKKGILTSSFTRRKHEKGKKKKGKEKKEKECVGEEKRGGEGGNLAILETIFLNFFFFCFLGLSTAILETTFLIFFFLFLFFFLLLIIIIVPISY